MLLIKKKNNMIKKHPRRHYVEKKITIYYLFIAYFTGLAILGEKIKYIQTLQLNYNFVIIRFICTIFYKL